MNRKLTKYENLFDKYEDLDNKQSVLYGGKIWLPEEKKPDWKELQIKKIAILEEMEKCL